MKFTQDYTDKVVMIQLPTGQEIAGLVKEINNHTLILDHPFLVSLNTNNNNVLLMPFTLSMLAGNTVEINILQIFSIAELSEENADAYKDHVRATTPADYEEIDEEPIEKEDPTPFMDETDA